MAKINVGQFDTTANAVNNTDVDGVGIAEDATPPENLNNALRSAMAIVGEWASDLNGADLTAGGTNGYTLATTGTHFASQALADISGLVVKFTNANTAAGASVTLAVDSLTATQITKNGGSDLAVGDIQAGSIHFLAYDGSTFEIVGAGNTWTLTSDLDLNGNNIDFPTTANISDVLDEDDMASNSATMLATQQSIKAYVDLKKVVRATANQDVAASTTLVDDDHFAFSLAANQRVMFMAMVFYSGPAAADIKIAFNIDDGLTPAVMWSPANGIRISAADTVVQQDAITALDTAVVFGAGGAGVERQLLLVGKANPGAATATLRMRWAQNTSDATLVRRHADSYMMVWPVT